MNVLSILDQPDQQFGTIIGGKRVTIRVRYNPVNDRWSFDLSIDDLPVLHGRKIIPGVDLLAPFDFGLGVIFAAVVTDGAVPDRQSLPNGAVKLFHATSDEVAAVA